MSIIQEKFKPINYLQSIMFLPILPTVDYQTTDVKKFSNKV